MALDGTVPARPRPLRPFSLTDTPPTAQSSRPPSPTPNPDDPSACPPSRNRSILNLTSSTLFGIYSTTDYPDKDDPSPSFPATPVEGRSRAPSQPDGAGLAIDAATWQEKSRRRRSSVLDTSAKRTRERQALRRRESHGKRRPQSYSAGKTLALAAVGVCYGVLIGHLHDRRGVAPVKVEGIRSESWQYMAFWGVVAVILGSVMPAVDAMWDGELDEDEDEVVAKTTHKDVTWRGRWAPGWNDVVRSIGAFVGIAFAIRRLPWQSTLQLSLTLALSNPAIWYLLDRTASGLVFSTAVALSGTAVMLAINRDLIPPPARPSHTGASSTLLNASLPAGALESDRLIGGMFSHESIGVATWLASVLFVCCVCFGAIGRRLR